MPRLVATGLDAVLRVVVSSDEMAHGKPAPDVYLEAARRLGVTARACLVVEDSLNGVRRRQGGRHDRRPRPEPQRAARTRGAMSWPTVVLDRLADLDPDAVP